MRSIVVEFHSKWKKQICPLFRERNGILSSKNFIFSELHTFSFSIFKEYGSKKDICTDKDEEYSDYIGYESRSEYDEHSKEHENKTDEIHKSYF